MKRTQKILIITLLVVIIIVTIIAVLLYIEDNKVGEFRLSDYQEDIDMFATDIVLGDVLDSATARKLAERIWKEEIGERAKKWNPYKVFFDKENKVWLVKGTLAEGLIGGEPYLLIRQQDGKVLAMWFTQ